MRLKELLLTSCAIFLIKNFFNVTTKDLAPHEECQQTNANLRVLRLLHLQAKNFLDRIF